MCWRFTFELLAVIIIILDFIWHCFCFPLCRWDKVGHGRTGQGFPFSLVLVHNRRTHDSPWMHPPKMLHCFKHSHNCYDSFEVQLYAQKLLLNFKCFFFYFRWIHKKSSKSNARPLVIKCFQCHNKVAFMLCVTTLILSYVWHESACAKLALWTYIYTYFVLHSPRTQHENYLFV